MVSREKLHRGASRIHKWLALIVGLQVLIWFGSGAFMSYVPIERVRGEHLISRSKADPLPAQLDVTNAMANLPFGTTSAEIVMADSQPIVVARKGKQDIARFNPQSGAMLPMLDHNMAERIVHAAWLGNSHPALKADWMTRHSSDFHGDLPVWRVTLSDQDNTRAYVSPITGKIVAVRTGTWRLYDFLWGLHIMDWKSHENFNSPWLFAFALGGLMLALAGVVLLAIRWPRRRKKPNG